MSPGPVSFTLTLKLRRAHCSACHACLLGQHVIKMQAVPHSSSTHLLLGGSAAQGVLPDLGGPEILHLPEGDDCIPQEHVPSQAASPQNSDLHSTGDDRHVLVGLWHPEHLAIQAQKTESRLREVST